MQFADLVERLRAEERPSWLVHRAQLEERGTERFDWCRDAWNLGHFDGRWRVIRGWGADRTDDEYPDEESACAALYDHVVATGEVGVRALSLDELPLPAQRLVRLAGLEPLTPRPGDRYVADDGMAVRVVAAPDGYRVDRPSALPPTVGDVWFRGLSLEDAARIVLVVAGNRLPECPGVPSWGVPGSYRAQAEEGLRRFRDVSLERIEEAYLGVPEGLLSPLGIPPALDLLTTGLAALADAQGYFIVSRGGPDSVYLDSATEGGYALSRVADGFVVLERGERSNDWLERERFVELAEARQALVARLRPRGDGSGRRLRV